MVIFTQNDKQNSLSLVWYYQKKVNRGLVRYQADVDKSIENARKRGATDEEIEAARKGDIT